MSPLVMLGNSYSPASLAGLGATTTIPTPGSSAWFGVLDTVIRTGGEVAKSFFQQSQAQAVTPEQKLIIQQEAQKAGVSLGMEEILPWAIGGAALLVVLVLVMNRRRR